MIFEVSFAMIGGINFGLEKSWGVVKGILQKYPNATWRRIVDRRHKKGKYVVEVE